MMRVRALLFAGAALTIQPGMAWAQSGDDGQRLENEAIIVTATRTGAQNVQSVPIAVTAFGAEQIQYKGIVEVADLGFHVPNLSVVSEAQGSVTFGIRGINVAVDSFSFDNAVGIYQNDVYIARSSDVSTLMFDVGSVEVLRGPQGTTFGRNTPTGAIVITSKRPGHEFGGYVKGQVGFGKSSSDHDRFIWRGEAALDIPLGPQFAVRLAGYYEKDDGYGRSTVSGFKYNSRNDYAVRGTLVGDLADNLKVTLIGEHSRTEHSIMAYRPVYATGGMMGFDNLSPGTATPVADSIAAMMADGSKYLNRSELANAVYKGKGEFGNGVGLGKGNSVALHLDWDVADNVNFRSITAYRDIDQTTIADNDMSEYQNGTAFNHIIQRQYSQEFLLNVRPGERFSFLTGLFLFREEGSDENNIPFQVISVHGALGQPAPIKGPLASGGTYVNARLNLRGEDIVYKALGVFANVSWEFIDGLTASGGIRLSHENKRAELNSLLTIPAFGDAITPIATGPVAFKDDPILYDAKLTWQASDSALVYAKYGTGYRAGGVGFRARNTRFDPETVSTYEIGAKLDFDLGAMPVRTNLAAFRSAYKGFQVPLVLLDPGTGAVSQTVVNAGRAVIKGFEAEITAKPTMNFDLGASVGVLDAGYSSFVLPAGNTVSPAGAPVDLSGNRLRRAPRLSLTLNGAYRVPLGESELLFQLDYNYQSSQALEPIRQSGAPLQDMAGNLIRDQKGNPGLRTDVFELDHVSQLNGLIKLSNVAGTGVAVSLWGKNLLNQQYPTYALALDYVYEVTYASPRTFGLTVEKSF